LIKAVAGGGGKGMRKVERQEDFIAALESCQREAASSFADERVLIEKYITSPRHIEIQIFGDQHGNVIHLFERDCSVQRRHQKVIEEAPAPGMSTEVRTAMTNAAIDAAKAVDYIGAGTVEFIVDGSGELQRDGFWFMEMNTRLQVEHPVTEKITGLDLVELQIRVARGEVLPAQSAVSINGHAIEARLYAEDPREDFLPSIGTLEILSFPDNARIDTGIEQGGEVSVFYDPLIAKVIVHKPDRLAAIDALEASCRDTHVFPIKTNARFLADCLAHTVFRSGNVSTHFIPQNAETLLATDTIEEDKASLSWALMPETKITSPFEDCSGWRLNQAPRKYFYRRFDGNPIQFDLHPDAEKINRNLACYNHPKGDVIFVGGLAYLIETGTETSIAKPDSNMIIAPMPGKIIAVNAKVGDTVSAGQALIVMEAMKMETTLEAPKDAIVTAVHTESEAIVPRDFILIEISETEA